VSGGVPQILLSATWSPASDEAQLLLTTPTGEVLDEADIAARPDMTIVEHLSDSGGRVVAVDSPEAGVWSIQVVNTRGLESVEFNGLAALIAPSIEVSAVGGMWGSPVTIQYEAHDADSDAGIQLYYDTDNVGADGTLIAGGLEEHDAAASFAWHPDAVEPGEYFIYAMIEDGVNPPQIVYATESVSVGSPGIVVNGPSSGVPGQPLEFVVLVDSQRPLTYEFDWNGDGMTDEVQTVAGGQLDIVHAFDLPGSIDIGVTVVEPASGAASFVSKPIEISQVQLQGQDLLIGGNRDGNRIVVSLANDGGVSVRLDQLFLGTFAVSQRILVFGHEGDDFITVSGNFANSVEFHGGPGNDYLSGGRGDDHLLGGPGDDRLLGGDGNNFLDGGEGNDRLFGRGGNDILLGGPGDDQLLGGDGNNLLDAGEGDDRLAGGRDDDILLGGWGNDNLAGFDGNDLLAGGDGDDDLFGHGGNDVILGGEGRDWLRGERGDDLLIARLTVHDRSSATDIATAAALDAVLREVVTQWQAGQFDANALLLDDDDDETDDLLGNLGTDWFHTGPLDRVRDFQVDDRLN
jgi:hypothetical protein